MMQSLRSPPRGIALAAMLAVWPTSQWIFAARVQIAMNNASHRRGASLRYTSHCTNRLFQAVYSISSKTEGPGEEGAARYRPKILLPRRAKKSALFSPQESYREICSRNRPLSETKFLDDFWGPLSLPAPLSYC